MDEKKILEEANKYLAEILERKGAGNNVPEVYARELVRCILDYRFCYAANEEFLDEIYDNCLYALNKALEPYRDFDKYVVTPKDRLMYAICHNEYISKRKRET